MVFINGRDFKSPVRGFSIHQVGGLKYWISARVLLTSSSACHNLRTPTVLAMEYSVQGGACCDQFKMSRWEYGGIPLQNITTEVWRKFLVKIQTGDLIPSLGQFMANGAGP